MNFVAIDFETANEKRYSPCSLGITIVENGKIVEEKYWLIKPYEMRFSNMNTMIHGIREKDVENEKSFDVLWKEIKPYFEDRLIVAHNAAFDISVLRKTLDIYSIEYPTFDYLCTMVIARKFFSSLENVQLNTVSNFLGYQFEHHNASADATACAKILLSIFEETSSKDVFKLIDAIGVKVGKVYKEGYVAPKSLKGNFEQSKKIYQQKEKITNENSDFFANKTVVFTGPLNSMKRSEGIKILRGMGAQIGSSVTKKTNILIIGGKNGILESNDITTTKLSRANRLVESGQKIHLMKEDEFLSKIK